MKQMATTLVAAAIRGDNLTIANVGDSRAYLARGDTIQQITEDHSLVAGLLADGVITPEEAAEHPQRNVILSSLGSAPDEPRVDIHTRRLRPADAVLLCTDGLTRYTSDDQLLALLNEEPENQAAQRLIDFANAAGGLDNVTVAVLRATRSSRAWWRWRLLIGAVVVVISGFLGLALAALGLIGPR
jgi:protein phosphatase